MAKRYEVKCINKPHRDSPYEHITNIGYQDGDYVFIIAVEKAISQIEKKEAEFYVSVGTHQVVVIVEERYGRKYIKTEPDKDKRDNLLSLRECGPIKS